MLPLVIPATDDLKSLLHRLGRKVVQLAVSKAEPPGSVHSDPDVRAFFFERFDDAIPQFDSVKPLVARYCVDADLDMDVTSVVAKPGCNLGRDSPHPPGMSLIRRFRTRLHNSSAGLISATATLAMSHPGY
jgi:hypothetical protein